MKIDSTVISALAPTGKLRAAINLGNPILANRHLDTDCAYGVSVDLAAGLAAQLGVKLELVVFDAAAKAVDAVSAGEADVGFFAVDPLRAATIAFTAPYVLIEGCYLVKAESPIHSIDEVDHEGHRVVVGKGSAYDLYLTRELRNAQIFRAPTSPAVLETFLVQHADVAAGVKQQLESDARKTSGLRMLQGRFMVIPQAMGLPRSRGADAHRCLEAFVENMKSSSFVAQALARHGIEGASVAPAR